MIRPSLALKLLLILFLLLFLASQFPPFNESSSTAQSRHATEPLSPTFDLSRNLHRHGQADCLPQLDLSRLGRQARSWRRSCAKAPFRSSSRRDRRIGTLTALGTDAQDYYKRAAQLHLLHALVHDSNLHVLCSPLLDDPSWNKPALILSVLLTEMAKPVDERLEWLLWAEADTVILDQCRPVSSFLPEEVLGDGYVERITAAKNADHRYQQPQNTQENGSDNPVPNLLYTTDRNGLNNGVFLLRVNSWAVDFFVAVLGHRILRPEVETGYFDQTAMALVITEPQFRENVVEVPQTWFNAYPSVARDSANVFANGEDTSRLWDYEARRGDFLAHFAGHDIGDAKMDGWMDMLGGLWNVWETGRAQRDASAEVEAFWTAWLDVQMEESGAGAGAGTGGVKIELARDETTL